MERRAVIVVRPVEALRTTKWEVSCGDCGPCGVWTSKPKAEGGANTHSRNDHSGQAVIKVRK